MTQQMHLKPAASESKEELKQALGELKPFLKDATWLSLVISLLSLTSTVYMLQVYDRVVSSRSLSTLAMLTVVALGAYLILEILEWVRASIMSAAAKKFEQELISRVFDAVFMAGLQRSVQVPQQSLNDLRTLKELIASPLPTAVMDAPVSLLLLLVIFLISPVLGWCAIFGGIVQLFLGFLTEQRSYPPLVLANKAAIAAQSYANGTLRNAQAIEAMGMLPDIRERWMQRQREFIHLQAVASEHAGSLMAASKMIQMLQSSALLGMGCWLYLQGNLAGGGGMMIVASILGGKVLQPLMQIVASWKLVINARDAFQRLNQHLEKVAVRETGMALPPARGELSVEGVVAAPPGSNVPVIRGVSFKVPAGQFMAIIGPSAAGKTTLARLLIGVWPTLSGKVRLDGADVFNWNKAELGPQVGYLPQSISLFDGTLADNVARFGQVDPPQVEQALSMVGLGEWLSSLPEGIHTRVGDDGDFLSGGVRQRVGLARAIYGMPRLLVLDEPNSNLDKDGELALLNTLRHLKSVGVTVVVITHRRGLLEAADQILLLAEGAVQMCGPRDEVLASLTKAQASLRAKPLRAA